jgi:hypothetical protein
LKKMHCLVIILLLAACVQTPKAKPSVENRYKLDCSEIGDYKLIDQNTIEYRGRISGGEMLNGYPLNPVREYYKIYIKNDNYFDEALKWILEREPNFMTTKMYTFTASYQC